MTQISGRIPRDTNHVPLIAGIDSSNVLTGAPVLVAVDAATNRMLVQSTGTLTISSLIPGTGATNLGKAEDAAHGSGDVGVMSLGVANEAQANLSDTDGDYTPIGTDRKGIVYTKGGFTEMSGLSAGSLNADLLASTDVSGYKQFSVQVLTIASGGVLTCQASNDNANWVTVQILNQASPQGGSSNNITAAPTVFLGAIQFRYLRIRQTSYSSGSSTGLVELFTFASGAIQGSVGASQLGTWNVGSNSATGSAVPANAFYVGIKNSSGNLTGWDSVSTLNDGTGGTSVGSVAPFMLNGAGTGYSKIREAVNATDSTGTGLQAIANLAQFDDSSPTTITENRFGNLRISSNRNLYGTIRDAAGNERGANVTAANELVVADFGLRPSATSLNTYAVHITTNTTNTPVSATAYISSIAISVEVAGTTSTVTIQDKQGTPLKLVNALTTVAATTAPQIYNFQTPVKMTSGIDVITAGAVASTVDVWINYYT